MKSVGAAVVCGLVGVFASSAQAQPFRLLPPSAELSRAALELRLAVPHETWDLAARLEPEAEYFNGLPWEVPRFSLFDVYSAEPIRGYRLTLGTVGEMTTSFDGGSELAGVRRLSQATFPGVRLRTPMLAPIELGAGFLVALNGKLQPDRSWGVFELTGRL